jgi:hypothetical protein
VLGSRPERGGTEEERVSTVVVTDTVLEVSLSRTEKVLGLLRDQVVPLKAVTGVEVVADGLAAPRGVRSPGFAWPGARKVGTWRSRGHKQLVDVRRGQPALRVRLAGQEFDELLLGSDDAAALAERLSR